ncbi:uncharacterized protein SOCE26_076470 [Sorangium cellulosum]|uniref:PE-PGRS family protein n=1 Tax=Sorangium cellulosum TaxID=56 RepID=A0A2L0F3K5_SORCE|nr:hypothetical protein [Sorangium cellulosum]AUX46142.1 uncharacterized protein SOCE26_076470 [Sorangium cellulosum]
MRRVLAIAAVLSLLGAPACSSKVREFASAGGGGGSGPGSGGGGAEASSVSSGEGGGQGGGGVGDGGGGQGGAGEGGGGGQGGGGQAAGIYVSTWDALYRFDPKAASLVRVGPFDCIGDRDGASVTDIAITGDGKMVGLGSDAGYPYQLLSIDPASGACSFIGPVGSDIYPSALGVVPAGALDPARETLVALVEKSGGGYSTYYASVDPSTGQAATLANLNPYISGTFADLAVAADTQQLYGISQPGNQPAGAPDHLVEIDPASGQVTLDLGSTGIDSFGGLVYWEGQLYGFTSRGTVYGIDRATAQVTEVPIASAPESNLIFSGAAAF